MANLSDCPCIRCIVDEKRVTEEFPSAEAAQARLVDLTAKGMTFNYCQCGDVHLICYRGLACSTGTLPRYEGERLAAP